MVFSFVTGYFRETTVHGFRYVANERSLAGRLFWVCIITAGFTVAGIMVSSSMRDANANPIITSVESIPVQDIPFPAFTVKGARGYSGGRLLQQALNTIKFDCYDGSKHEGGDLDACIRETQPVRSDFAPFLAKAVREKYAEAKSILILKLNDTSKRSTFDAVDAYLCHNMDGRNSHEISELFDGLNKTKGEELVELENNLIDRVARTFRMPQKRTFESMWELHHGQEKVLFVTFPQESEACKKQVSQFSTQAKIVVTSILTILGNSPLLPLGLILSDTSMTSTAGDYPKNTTDMLELIKAMMEKYPPTASMSRRTLGDLNLSYNFLALYLENIEPRVPEVDTASGFTPPCPWRWPLYSIVLGHSNSLCEETNNTECCKLERTLWANRDLVLRLMKYTYLPPSSIISTKSDIEDIEHLSFPLPYKLVNNRKHDKPVMLACKYPKGLLSEYPCDEFEFTYTSEGIGYSYNQDYFWNMFQMPGANRAIYETFYQRGENTLTASGDSVYPRKIKSHGPAFSLQVAIKIHMDGEISPDQVALHSPYEIADFSTSSVNLKPGFTYTFLVHPSVIETDDSALSMDIEKRKCMSTHDKHNLKAFKHYSQSSCLYECHLRLAVQACNCTKWDYIAYDESVPLCTSRVGFFCFKDVMSRPPSDLSQCSCPSNCQSYMYEQSIVVEKTTYANLFKAVFFSQKIRADVTPNHFLTLCALSSNYTNSIHQCTMRQEADQIALVRVVVASPVAFKTTRSRRVTFSDQLASIGGIIGLFSGMSFLSLAELLFWFAKGASVGWARTSGASKGLKKATGKRRGPVILA